VDWAKARGVSARVRHARGSLLRRKWRGEQKIKLSCIKTPPKEEAAGPNSYNDT